MKILSAKVCNYRVHECVEVEFHDHISVLGGANEAGKSTLMEAIHRALFVSAKGQTEVHRNMARAGSNEKPKVSLTFEHQGVVWELDKVYGGNTGYSVTLRERGQPSISDEAAEAKLREITGAEVEKGKRLKEDVARKPWSHLWVWQGASGQAPTDFIEESTDQLVNLTARGAGSVLMSNLDSTLAGQFQQEHQARATKTNTPKAGSPLKLALDAQSDCESKVAALRERVQRLEAAARTHAEAKQRQESAHPKLVEARQSLAAVEQQIASGEHKRLELERDTTAARQAETDAKRLVEDNTKLKAWNASIGELTSRLAEDDQTGRLTQLVDEATEAVEAQRLTVKRLRTQLAGITDRQGEAETYVRSFRAQQDLASAKTNHGRIAKLREELKAVRTQLEALPEIASSGVDHFRDKAQNHAVAEAQLNAIASTLKVVSGADELTANGIAVTAGTSVNLSQETILRYGDALELHLTVPGNADWEAKSQKLIEQRQALQNSIARYLIGGKPAASIEALAEAARQREVLTPEGSRLKRLIEGENPVQVKNDLQAAEQAAALAEADIARLSDAAREAAPATLPEAMVLAQAVSTEYREQNTAVDNAAASLQTSEKLEKVAQQKLKTFEEARREQLSKLKTDQDLRQFLLASHDASEDRFRENLSAAEGAYDAAKRKLNRTREAYDALELDVLQTQQRRYAEQTTRFQQDIQLANNQQQQALGQLRPEGESNPFAELRDVEELLLTTKSDCERHTVEAAATALLNDLFQQELDAANERITQPLAERVQTYLRFIDKSAEIRLNYVDSQFTEFLLYRPALNPDPEPFSTLSGGAREQVAAAVRLATAEILAEDYGGTLPVVFDDAFVNSDKERVNRVVEMLYHAKERGLQVIIGTCDPERYGGVGLVEYKMVRGRGAERLV